jgi:hypothetical protein
MHCVVSWDITDAFLPLRSHIEAEMVVALHPHAWVKPLTTFYVVQFFGSDDYHKMISRLQSVGLKYPGRCRIIVSPLMVGGRYNGSLNQAEWNQLNLMSA